VYPCLFWFITHPKLIINTYFKSLDNCEKQAAHDDSNEVTPRRGALRKRAHENLSKPALSMKRVSWTELGNTKCVR